MGACAQRGHACMHLAMSFWYLRSTYFRFFLIGEDLQKKGSWFKGSFLCLKNIYKYKISRKLYSLRKVYDFFCHNFQTKIRLLIKSTFYVYIGTVEFSSLFKESPCSPVVTFPSFVSKCHGVQPRRGASFSIFVRVFNFTYVLLYNLFFHYVSN